jgi:hypothetical protein
VPYCVTTQQLQQYTAFKRGLFLAHNCKYLHTGDDGDDDDDDDKNNNSDIFSACINPILSQTDTNLGEL